MFRPLIVLQVSLLLSLTRLDSLHIKALTASNPRLPLAMHGAEALIPFLSLGTVRGWVLCYFLVLLKELPAIDAYLVPHTQMTARAGTHSQDWPGVNLRKL